MGSSVVSNVERPVRRAGPDMTDKPIENASASPAAAPSPPPGAAAIFGAGLPAAERYAGWLADAGIVRGLLGPREADRLWDRHLINSALLADLVPNGARVADLGSGAGLPGIPLALARPDLAITLVEPLLRRATFLQEVVADLASLDASVAERLDVVRSRAEDLPKGLTFDVVTSRALAPLDRLLKWSMPLVAPGGKVLALKGSSVRDEVEAAAADLRRRNLVARVVEVDSVAGGITVVVIERH